MRLTKVSNSFLVLITGIVSLTPMVAFGQVSSDKTLNTTVQNANDLNFTILNGNRVGNNLFHSFNEFSIPGKGSAIFQNATDIQNIFSRVTGGKLSNIQGLLQTQGTANLFLINPSGIIFGNNAKLDVGGSFFATTADSIIFKDGLEFSATKPQTQPLLSVNIPIGLRFRDNAKGITNQSRALNAFGDPVGLEVKPGKNLALIGGQVNLNGGAIYAPGGRVELGGLSQAGVIGFNLDKGSFQIPQGIGRSDVFLSNDARVAVYGTGGGDIAVNARNLEIDKGYLFAGIEGIGTKKAGNIIVNANNIKINRSRSDATGIYNQVREKSVGNAGDILINTDNLYLNNGAQISASTLGKGNAGNIDITVSNQAKFDGIYFYAPNNNYYSSGLFNRVEGNGVGNAGIIKLKAGSLDITRGAQISSISRNQGNAGKVIIDIPNGTLKIDGFTNYTLNNGAKRVALSYITTALEQGAKGKAGDISIKVGNLLLSDGSQITSTTSGIGDGGNIDINVSNQAKFDGIYFDTSINDYYSSGLFNRVGNNGIGNAGIIKLKAGSLDITRGAQISSISRNQGNAGKVIIDVSNGTLKLDGVTKYINNQGNQLVARSFIDTALDAGAKPKPGDTIKAGDINIKARNLFITNGSQISSTTFGKGDAGNIDINVANQAKLDGISPISFFASGLFSGVGNNGIGNAGAIKLKAGSLDITRGAQISSISRNQGNAGKVIIDIPNGTLKIDGFTNYTLNNGAKRVALSYITTALEQGARGKAGDIEISAKDIIFTNGGRVFSSTYSGGDAGNISLIAKNKITFNGGYQQYPSGLFSTVENEGVGNGGDIKVEAKNLDIFNGAVIFSIARNGMKGEGGNVNSGNINIIVDDTLRLDGVSQINSSLSSDTQGKAGNINIIGKNLLLTGGSQIISTTSGIGDGGNIDIKLSNQAKFDGIYFDTSINDYYSSGLFNRVGNNGIGNAGIIKLKAGSLDITRGAQISSISRNQGNAGKVTIDIPDGTLKIDGFTNYTFNNGVKRVALSYITTALEQGAKGKAGDISIKVGNLLLSDGSQITSTTSGIGDGGNIDINVSNQAKFDGIYFDFLDSAFYSSGLFSRVGFQGVGNAGIIKLKAGSLDITRGAQISSISRNQGNAGKVIIDVAGTLNIDGITTFIKKDGKLDFARSIIDTALDAGAKPKPGNTIKAGNINIKARNLFITNGGQISSSSFGIGDGGKIDIRVNDKINIESQNNYLTGIFSRVFKGARGNGGDIFIDPKRVLIRGNAGISVSNFGTGKSGNIELIAGGLTLDKKAFIEANTTNTQNPGGNITLKLSDFLLMRRNSRISTDSGLDGGNITINSPFIVAPAKENSDITANAIQRQGGNIIIQSESVYGIKPSAILTPESDITASSEKGNPGVVTLNSTQINAADDLATLPEEVTDASQLVAQHICRKKPGSSFIVVGRGGIPIDPNQFLPSDNVRVDLAESINNPSVSINSPIYKKDNPSKPISNQEITPARGWVMNEKGEVVLTAYDPTEKGISRSLPNSAICNGGSYNE
ncbi:two-partner secretion domain-containing protein [Calothrix sp. 336/3]|uniref:two-partner secretion domain-containing protein n=1 Tax=Calothrix sp. 336/3 TaxID=1337936 RepID=UPI00055725B6|nr:filamentous hemagglutinin N-terminal domain-containing protein [Calothrix sp. 336/3]